MSLPNQSIASPTPASAAQFISSDPGWPVGTPGESSFAAAIQFAAEGRAPVPGEAGRTDTGAKTAKPLAKTGGGHPPRPMPAPVSARIKEGQLASAAEHAGTDGLSPHAVDLSTAGQPGVADDGTDKGELPKPELSPLDWKGTAETLAMVLDPASPLVVLPERATTTKIDQGDSVHQTGGTEPLTSPGPIPCPVSFTQANPALPENTQDCREPLGQKIQSETLAAIGSEARAGSLLPSVVASEKRAVETTAAAASPEEPQLAPAAHGISTAKMTVTMESAENHTKIAQPAVKLALPPETATVRSPAETTIVTGPGSVPDLPVVKSNISAQEWTAAASLPAINPDQSQKPSPGSLSREAAGSVESTREIFLHMAGHVAELKHFGLDSMSVVLKPDSATELFLRLSEGEGMVEIQDQFERADFQSLRSHWDDVQNSWALQGVRLGAFAGSRLGGHTPTEHQAGHLVPRQGRSPRESFEPFPKQDLGGPAARPPGKSITKSNNSVPRRWESWA